MKRYEQLQLTSLHLQIILIKATLNENYLQELNFSAGLVAKKTEKVIFGYDGRTPRNKQNLKGDS